MSKDRRKGDKHSKLGGSLEKGKSEQDLKDEIKKAAKRQREVGMDLSDAVERKRMKPWKKDKP